MAPVTAKFLISIPFYLYTINFLSQIISIYFLSFLEGNADIFLDNIEYCHKIYNVINCSHQPLGILIWWSKYKHIILLQRKGSCRFHHRFLSALLYFLRQKTSDTKHFYAQFLHHIA